MDAQKALLAAVDELEKERALHKQLLLDGQPASDASDPQERNEHMMVRPTHTRLHHGALRGHAVGDNHDYHHHVIQAYT